MALRFLTDTRSHCSEAIDRDYLPLLDVVTACVIDSCCSRIDAVHDALSVFLVSVCRFHGAESPMPTFHGMHPMTLYRCIDAAMRSYNYFSRKRVYAMYLHSFAAGTAKQKEIDAKQKVPRGGWCSCFDVCHALLSVLACLA
jgi:hypothetical protein